MSLVSVRRCVCSCVVSALILVHVRSVGAQNVPVPEDLEGAAWILDIVGGPVSPSNPSVQVRISAAYPSQYFSFWGGDLDLLSSDPTGVFSNMQLPLPFGPYIPGMMGVGWEPGRSVGGGVQGIEFLQHWAYPMNPLPIWEGTWTTTDFTPRTAQITSANTENFRVTIDTSIPLGLFLTNMQPEYGSGTITVIPATPTPTLAACGVFSVLGARRRR